MHSSNKLLLLSPALIGRNHLPLAWPRGPHRLNEDATARMLLEVTPAISAVQSATRTMNLKRLIAAYRCRDK